MLFPGNISYEDGENSTDPYPLYPTNPLSSMSESRVTEPRKRFVELLSQSSRITFSDLRKDLVGKK